MDQIRVIAEQFQTEGKILEIQPFGNGLINTTYQVICAGDGSREKRYILQRINHDIFKKPWELMENIRNVSEFLKKKITAAGGDPERETLTVIGAGNQDYVKTESGEYWRMYLLIEDAYTMEAVEKPEDFYHCAVSFGNFQRQLADYPAETLYETIPNFHNTVSRFADFVKAVEADVCGRKAEVEAEIRFIMEREADCRAICDALTAGEIPLRVTHNDTKINNIMLDNETGKAICVIDLDTIMPGSSLYDFGDSIRSGANTGAEDETDLSKVSCDTELFECYARGYVEGCAGSLTDREIDMLPMGAKVITLEQGIRFLTDYLQGDTYYKTTRPGQNLDRTRTQLKMVADMEQKWDVLQEIVKNC